MAKCQSNLCPCLLCGTLVMCVHVEATRSYHCLQQEELEQRSVPLRPSAYFTDYLLFEHSRKDPCLFL